MLNNLNSSDFAWICDVREAGKTKLPTVLIFKRFSYLWKLKIKKLMWYNIYIYNFFLASERHFVNSAQRFVFLVYLHQRK